MVNIDITPSGLWRGSFATMASPCEILVDCDDPILARQLIESGYHEATRIEHTFSRYRDDNTIHRINTARGHTVEVDAELAALLTYANTCYQLSDGLFDITSGILRRVWTFDGSDKLPDQAKITALLPLVGWGKVQWAPPVIQLPAGMEIDLGGLGKEYAVDRVISLVGTHTPVLVNLGGDLAANGPQRNGQPWRVAIEDPQSQTASTQQLQLSCGAIATSGDSRRFILTGGIRYSHILNPKTGWPVAGAPRSVTVVADTCLEAGFLSTLAMLHGEGAEPFLEGAEVNHLVIR